MLAPLVVALLVAGLLGAGALASAHDARSAPGSCAPRRATEAYAGSVQQAIDSRRDLWGSRLLAAPGGPTYRAAQRFLNTENYVQVVLNPETKAAAAQAKNDTGKQPRS